MSSFGERILELRKELSPQPGPFSVVEGENPDNPWRWAVHSAHQPIATGLFEEVARFLVDVLNAADVAMAINSGGGQAVIADVVPVDLTGISLNDFLLKVLEERRALRANMSLTQERSTQLLLKAREWRKKIVELGGEDPGPP
jgi:hypothetical protein